MLNAYTVALGGAFVLLALAFQVSLGMRWIKIPGGRQWKVHKVVGLSLIGLGLVHGLAALLYLGIIGGLR